MEETLEAAALRELEEETGVSDVTLTEVGVFGAPSRDPRGARNYDCLRRCS